MMQIKSNLKGCVEVTPVYGIMEYHQDKKNTKMVEIRYTGE